MNFEMLSSDSDREVFDIISNSSETDSEEQIRRDRIYKERVDYLALPDSYAFQVRFRLDKESTEQLLLEIHPQHYKSNRN